MDGRAEVLRALVHLIAGDVLDRIDLAPGLLAHLAPERVLGRLALIDAATGKEPRAGIGARDLAHEEHAAGGVDARDDRRLTPPAVAHATNLLDAGRAETERYGFLLCPGFCVGVGAGVMPGGSVGPGEPDGLGPLGDGLGDGVGEGLGQGCELMMFHE